MQPGNSLVVQWLGLSTSTAEVLGSTFGQGTKVSQALLCSQKRKNQNGPKGRGEVCTRERYGRVPNSKLLLFPPWTPPRRQNTSPSGHMAHWFLGRQSTAILGSAHASVSRAFIWASLCRSWGRKESDMTELPNWTELNVGHDGERNGNTLQYSCLENPIDGGAW